MKITIITVVRDSVLNIERTILSVINQSFGELEYIIVDGASTDGTTEIIKQYDDKISYWISEKDNGIYDAMNKGISFATGEAVLFINAGDEVLPDTCSFIADFFSKNNDYDIFAGRVYIMDDGNIISISGQQKRHEKPWFAIPACHQAIVCKKNIFESEGGFSLDYNICADFEWVYRVSNKGYKIFWGDRIIAKYDINGTSNFNQVKSTKESFDISMKYFKNQKEKKEIRENYNKAIKRAYDDDFWTEKITDDRFLEICKNYFLSNSYVIWGAGVIGIRCVQILKKLNVKIEYIVDSNFELVEKVKKIYDVPIYLPNEKLREKKILIASKNAEETILANIGSLFGEEANAIMFSKIKEELRQRFENT